MNRISADYFAGKDLSNTKLSGVDLEDADLRGTRLNNTELENANLRGAKFLRQDIRVARIDYARISLYGLKTSQKSDFNPSDFGDEVMNVLPIDGLWVYGRSSFRDDLVWEISFPIENLQNLESSREMLARGLSTTVAIYFDECEELVRTAVLAKSAKKPRPLSKASR